MRKIGEALRLKAAGLSTRKIAVSLGIGQSTASEYLERAERAGLSWPLPDGMDDADLERRLFQPAGGETRRGLAQPDWPQVHRELRRKNVTLSLVWAEYRAAHGSVARSSNALDQDSLGWDQETTLGSVTSG